MFWRPCLWFFHLNYSFLKDQLISKGNLVSSILPKNENVNFCLSLLGQKFFVRFFGELKKPESSFEINWPLIGTFHMIIVKKKVYFIKKYPNLCIQFQFPKLSRSLLKNFSLRQNFIRFCTPGLNWRVGRMGQHTFWQNRRQARDSALHYAAFLIAQPVNGCQLCPCIPKLETWQPVLPYSTVCILKYWPWIWQRNTENTLVLNVVVLSRKLCLYFDLFLLQSTAFYEVFSQF